MRFATSVLTAVPGSAEGSRLKRHASTEFLVLLAFSLIGLAVSLLAATRAWGLMLD